MAALKSNDAATAIRNKNDQSVSHRTLLNQLINKASQLHVKMHTSHAKPVSNIWPWHFPWWSLLLMYMFLLRIKAAVCLWKKLQVWTMFSSKPEKHNSALVRQRTR